jgi:hypothetical protein
MKIFNIISNLFLVLITNFVFCQNNSGGGKSQNYNPNLTGGVFRSNNSAVIKPLGSPYFLETFSNVKVENINLNAKMRYNVFNDEFEFISTKNDTLILDKLEDFKDLIFVATNTKFKLINYLNLDNKIQYGYLIDIYQKNDFGLFKKDNILLTEEKIAKTSLEQSSPAKYNKSNPIYFLKTIDKIVEFPSNKKRLIKNFPDKKEQIEAFLKENKIDFDKEIDRIKIIDFLTTL